MIKSRAIKNISLVKRKVLAIWQSTGLSSGISQFVMIHVKPHLDEVSRANHRNEPYFLMTVGPKKQHRFAPVTDVKVLANCTYPMSHRIVMVKVEGGRHEGYGSGGRKKERRREREIPSFKPPTKNKILFPIRASSFSFSTYLCSSLHIARFSRVSWAETLFLDIYPQKCNNRPFPTVKPSTNGPDISQRGSMIPFHKVTREQRESFLWKVNSIDTIYFVLRYSQHGGERGICGKNNCNLKFRCCISLVYWRLNRGSCIEIVEQSYNIWQVNSSE